MRHEPGTPPPIPFPIAREYQGTIYHNVLKENNLFVLLKPGFEFCLYQ